MVIAHLAAEWRSIARSPAAVSALAEVAQRDEDLAILVFESPTCPALCPTPFDVLEHMRRATGRRQKEAAAHLIRVLLREADSDPFIGRMLVQALVPGLVGVASMLQWGLGGEWRDSEDFFGEVVSTTWLVVGEWSGQDRQYAVLDLLSAIRCRLRRQLLRHKDAVMSLTSLEPFLHARSDRNGDGHGQGSGHGRGHGHANTEDVEHHTVATETDLEQLARLLINLHSEGMDLEEVQVLYAQHVLGYNIAELSAVTGRERRVLYARRDRAQDRLCATAG